MAITDWEIENGGTLGEGSEQTPLTYPRSDEAREGSYTETMESDSNPNEDMAGGNADQQ